MSYQTVNLAMNLAGGAAALAAECNPGGSTICWSPTRGCGRRPMTCVTTSTSPAALEMNAAVASDELENLQDELAAVINKFVSAGGSK